MMLLSLSHLQSCTSLCHRRGQWSTQWLFEKAVSRLNDQTPVYEGVVVEHWVTYQYKWTGWCYNQGGMQDTRRVTANWESIIQVYTPPPP